MTEAPFGHLAHEPVNAVVRRAGADLPGHHVGHLHPQQIGAVICQSAREIALRDDAAQFFVRIGHHHRADALGLE